MDTTKHAMVLDRAGEVLWCADVPIFAPGPGQSLVKVGACAVCRTNLHVLDGELAHPKPPLIPGPEMIGTAMDLDADATQFHPGDRVGIRWLGWTCGTRGYSRTGHENLCAPARITGYQIGGGYACHSVPDEWFCFAIDNSCSDAEAAALTCAGLIGHRTPRMAT